MLAAPNLSVDPDFAEPVTLIRRTETIASNGVASHPETTSTIYAVIQKVSETQATKVPEGSKLDDWITIHYRGPLYVMKPGAGYSDVIIYKGVRYVVRIGDEDWSDKPLGSCVALAQIEAANV